MLVLGIIVGVLVLLAVVFALLCSDVISKPERLFETQHGDCDEFAVFAAEALNGRHNWMLSVTWCDLSDTKLRFKGHNVCIYPVTSTTYDPILQSARKTIEWWHIGNWGKHGPFGSIYETINSVVPEGCIGCAWSLRVAKGRFPGEKDLQFKFGGTFKHLDKKKLIKQILKKL